MDYMQMLNLHALKQFSHGVSMPDFHLMIGEAESLRPQKMEISQATIPGDVAENLRRLDGLTDEERTEAIANNILEVNDFNGNTAIVEELLGAYD